MEGGRGKLSSELSPRLRVKEGWCGDGLVVEAMTLLQTSLAQCGVLFVYVCVCVCLSLSFLFVCLSVCLHVPPLSMA